MGSGTISAEVVWFLEIVAAEIVGLSSKGTHGPGIDCLYVYSVILFPIFSWILDLSYRITFFLRLNSIL